MSQRRRLEGRQHSRAEIKRLCRIADYVQCADCGAGAHLRLVATAEARGYGVEFELQFLFHLTSRFP